jgi:reactive intermediate/imine deaminase
MTRSIQNLFIALALSAGIPTGVPTTEPNAPQRPAPAGNQPQATRLGNTVYLSGQVGRDRRTGQLGASLEDQVRIALENLGAHLGSLGMDFRNVVSSNVYLTDIANFARMNQVYGTFFKGPPPARTTVAVSALPGGAQIETAFIASSAPRRHITPSGHRPIQNAPYSPGVMAGDTLYLSGAGSIDPATGKLPEGPIEVHVARTMENIEAVLKAAGLDFSNVVSSNIYLTDMSGFAKMNEAYRTFFKAALPVRTTVGVAALPGGMPIEVTFVASRGARNVVRPEGIATNPNLSQAIAAGDTLYVSGKVGSGGDVRSQLKQAMDGVKTVLSAARRDFRDVVDAKVYLTNAADEAAALDVYKSYFESGGPAATLLVVPRLAGTAGVEVTVVAATTDR